MIAVYQYTVVAGLGRPLGIWNVWCKWAFVVTYA